MRRQHFALLHRYLGLALAVFLFVAGLGGALSAFQQEIDAWLNPAFYVTRSSGTALPLSALAARIESADPRVELAYAEIAPLRGETIRAYVQPRIEGTELGYDEVAINPANGDIQGRRLWGACCIERQNIMPFIVRLHYSLALPGALGQWVLGSVAIAWLIDCFVGVYLTFPRKMPFWAKWRKRWRVRLSAGAERAVYDSHNAGGLWPWFLLLILAMSSIDMNLDGEVFRPVVGFFTAVTKDPEHKAPPGALRRVGWDEALSDARREAVRRGWPSEVRWVSWQRAENAYHFGFDRLAPDTVDSGSRHELLVDADDGSIATVRDPAARTLGDGFVDLQFPLHTGRLLGLPGRVLVCVAGLATAVLSATGAWLWLRRQLRHRHETHSSVHVQRHRQTLETLQHENAAPLLAGEIDASLDHRAPDACSLGAFQHDQFAEFVDSAG